MVDWISIKLGIISGILGGTWFLQTGSKIVLVLTILSLLSTIIYNGIRIIKEYKNKP